VDKKIAWKQPFGMQVSTPIVHNQLFHAAIQRRFANLFLNYWPLRVCCGNCIPRI